jgi:hypothetical protein
MEDGMSNGPRVTRMVMFKHGVAYLERGGPSEGAFELSFKRDEMNDVLKSLAVWVARGDAKVGAVAFEAPDDPEAALAERKLAHGPGAALEGLLASVRGRKVRIDDGGSPREGEVVGIQETPGAEGQLRRQLLLRNGPGGLSLLDLASVRSIELVEETSRADLEFLIDRSRAATAGANRTVRVSLSGRAEDLRVAYVIPAPVWRVSYRIAHERDSTLLMAWGIVHNPADEDLDDIDLTLTTGQPVSFVIDLYHPKRVQRAVVEEQSRAAAAPTRFERARRQAPPPPMAMAMAPMAPSPTPPGGYGSPMQAQGSSMADSMAGSADGASVGVDRGEFFEYRVQAKVSLKRGGSAMVPLAAAPVKARRERIWRDGTGLFPDLTITFVNDSGMVLEEGPAVVYDEGSYAGESMVGYGPRGAEVKLAFAKDLALRCRRQSTQQAVLAGVRLGQHGAVEQLFREEPHMLTVESDHGEPVEVVFELHKTHGRDLHPEHAQPFEETASYRRFKLTAPPHGKAELQVRERWSETRNVQYTHLSGRELSTWLQGRFLDRATIDVLSGVLARWQEAAQLEQRLAAVQREQQEAYAKQTKISEQLGVLKEGGPEGSLRLRYVKELEAEQDKVNAAEAETRRLREGIEAARTAAARTLEQLTGARLR